MSVVHHIEISWKDKNNWIVLKLCTKNIMCAKNSEFPICADAQDCRLIL